MGETCTPRLEKRRVVLEAVPEDLTADDEVHFDVWTEPDGDIPPEMLESLFMRKETWEDMGSPQKVTITIEPGDRLNG